MKKTINLGAYGWRHAHWSGTFYPEDLPVDDGEDWRLSYYSNEFNAVLVPASYWLDEQSADCVDWLDSVPENFQFFVECHASMLASISLVDLTRALKQLLPQLSALVFLDSGPSLPESLFKPLLKSLDVDVISLVSGTENFALIEDDLTDLRSSRVRVEQFATQLDINSEEATLIISHPQLQVANLSKFRAMLEIMGY